MTKLFLVIFYLQQLTFSAWNIAAFTSTTTTTTHQGLTTTTSNTATSLSTSTTTTTTNDNLKSELSLQNKPKSKSKRYSKKPKSKCQICPEDNNELDRKEATFAILGMLWSTTTTVTTSITATTTTLLSNPQKANAAYGQDAKIELPNVMEGMNNRVNNQCLVESLGNRECLVYLDPEKKLYKGAEGAVLVESLEKATAVLAEIPGLVEEKKWSKIQGILTGPMNPLGSTMDKLSKLSDNEEKCCSLEKVVKNNLYALSAAVERKEGNKVLALHEKVTNDLVAYAKAL